MLLLSQLSFEIIMRENELFNHLGSVWDYDLIMSNTRLLTGLKQGRQCQMMEGRVRVASECEYLQKISL